MGTVRTPWVKRNHRKAFWQTGYTLVNSIAIDGSSEKSAVRLSLTYTKNEWIMPNTGFNRGNNKTKPINNIFTYFIDNHLIFILETKV